MTTALDKRGWSGEEDAFLRECWDDGQTASQIARQMESRSRCSVLGRVRRLGLPMRVGASAPRREKAVRVAKEPVFKSRPLPKEAPQEDEGPTPGLTLMNITDRHCRWPYDTPAGYQYCGRAPAEGKSFCPAHCRKAYQPAQTKASKTA